ARARARRGQPQGSGRRSQRAGHDAARSDRHPRGDGAERPARRRHPEDVMESKPIPVSLPTATRLSGVDAKTLRMRLDAAHVAHADEAETARKFESVLATQLVKQMRSSLEKGFFGEGAAGDIYSGWLDESVGQSLADRDALHL